MSFAYFTIEIIIEIEKRTGKKIGNSVILSIAKKRLIPNEDYKISPTKTGGVIFSQSGYNKLIKYYVLKYKNNAPS